MKKMKNGAIFLSLIALTCGVVLLPPRISGQMEKNAVIEPLFYDNFPENRAKLSSETVARLYYNREIDGGSALPFSVLEKEAVSPSFVISALEKMLTTNETLLPPIRAVIASVELNSYAGSQKLVKIENDPVALNLISCERKTDPYFSMLYEEKTETVIHMALSEIVMHFESPEEARLYFDCLTIAICDYYGTRLNLERDQYYCFGSVPEITQTAPEVWEAKFSISCGIMRYGDRLFFIENGTPLEYTY